LSPVQLPRTLVNRLLHSAQVSPDAEVCGLVGRKGDAVRLYPVANVAEDPAHLFRMDEHGQIDALRAMRERGEELFAIFHSHPEGPPTPSYTDLRESGYPDTLYLIVSLGIRGVLEMRGFYLRDGHAREVDVAM